jgi:hypothetical protein
MWFLNVRTVHEKSKWKLKMTKGGGGGLRWEEGGEERDRKGKRGEGRKEEKWIEI